MTKGNNASVSFTVPKTTSQKKLKIKKKKISTIRGKEEAFSRKSLFQSFNTLTYAKSTLFTGTASKTQIFQNNKVEENFENTYVEYGELQGIRRLSHTSQ